MSEFWEQAFVEKQEMWGLEPSQSAVIANQYFLDEKIKKILIPGFGYGRNARLFVDNGLDITGIEISRTAIELARKHYGDKVKIHHGSVTQMPFDDQTFDGIFCYSLIYLLNPKERAKLILDCYNQLRNGGSMIFAVLSTTSSNFGIGKKLEENWFETPYGVNLYFYNQESIKAEFGQYGLFEYEEMQENSFQFWLIKCKKPS
jgi:SAM-dependent methyltransferase